MTFHCLFEQSGTFKNEFKKLGYEAYDYDILNDFGETDYQIDLFKEIEDAYERERETIFDRIGGEDQIIAFFPCVRFEDQITMNFRGEFNGSNTWDDRQKLEYDLQLHEELNRMYSMVTKLAIICIDRKIPLVIENPRGTLHYLNRYWCLKPKVIDGDRRDRGDWFKKPTQYWFINREPSNNLVFEAININAIPSIGHDAWHNRRKSDYDQTGAKTVKVARSMIHPDYANRFIREFII